MHTDLFGDKDLEGRYDDGVMDVTFKEFQTYALDIASDEKESNGKNYHA